MVKYHYITGLFVQTCSRVQPWNNMELHLLPLFLLSLCFLVLIKLIKKSHTPKLNLPPGPWKLPIIGSIHHLLTSQPHHEFRRLSQQHGPLMLVRLGLVDTLVVSSPEVATEIMKVQDINFSSRPEIYIPKNLLYGCKNIAFTPYGDYWRQIRKIAHVELLNATKVRSFQSLFDEEITFFMLDIYKLSTEAKAVNLSGMLVTLMNNIIGRCAFGNKVDSAKQKVLISVLREVMKLLSGFYIVDLFPSIKYLDVLTGMKSKVQQLHMLVDEILQGIIKEHVLKCANNSPHDEKFEDILDVLLRIRRAGELEIPLSDDNLKAVILDMFIGGTHSSSTLVAWAMSQLMKNPRIMKKAKEEVRRVLKGKTKLKEGDFAELHYLKLVIKETLRFHPPSPLLVPKLCIDTCQVAGYDVPAGTRILVNAWAIGRDPRYWEDAEEFKPERFTNNPIDFKGANFEYLPFGAGRRMCPGVSFAIATMEFTLAYLLLHFDWELPDGMAPEELDMTGSFGLTDARRIDLYLLATPCSPTMDEIYDTCNAL